MITGLERYLSSRPPELEQPFGLLVHPASVDAKLRPAVELFYQRYPDTVAAIFGPQHGVLGHTQANMIEWEGSHDQSRNLPVYSLYGARRKPTPEMLSGLKTLVIDLQDVGSRYYTYIWTMSLCLEACGEAGVAVTVLDRPNPLDGCHLEGPMLDLNLRSFVGLHPVPVRHGLTAGEIAQYLKAELSLPVKLHVIRMRGWRRRDFYDQTGLPWVMPSPNMPTLDTALVYPGMCLLEGTTLSEGRGTTRPFELFGAPFIDSAALCRRLTERKLPAVRFRPAGFTPTFDKFKGELCHGAQIHVTNRKHFKPFLTAITILQVLRDMYGPAWDWKQPPYEYEHIKLPIDILAGDLDVRQAIDHTLPLPPLEKKWAEDLNKFKSGRRKYLLYN
jgi:uncharacterized protein YbbC (DUF1343 family)